MACKKRYVVEPRKPRAFLIGVKRMTMTELGHAKDNVPGDGVGSVGVRLTGRRSGRAESSVHKQTGCLIRHSTQGWGKPTTRERT